MSSASAGKRQREKKLQERAAMKREKRADRASRTDTDQPDSAELMERFRVLSEAFAAGAIEQAAYESEREAIFAELGLGSPFEG